ncbi:putative lactoylglutathione lyase [Medicago truncatula]|uniref:Putative lactoylglutathione lyase n=1 Tax=Medicago truncatula TaxID=3880 RepID=A0A396IVM5_MEDTR|nr:putative lactoylglutathione lyase [Medicago truncatula]
MELEDMLVNSGQEIIACFCHGHLILAAANLLEGCKCTDFPPLKPVLIAAGAHWVEHLYLALCQQL